MKQSNDSLWQRNWWNMFGDFQAGSEWNSLVIPCYRGTDGTVW